MSESPHVHIVEVPGIGQFTFAHRDMRADIRCSVEKRRLSEGLEPEVLGTFLTMFFDALGDLKVLMVDPPSGWSAEEIDRLDPFKDEHYGRILKVWSALRDKEEKFRSAGAAAAPTG